jgi:signal peptidase II
MKRNGLGLALLIFISDQISKILAVKYLTTSIEVTSFFNLALAYNKGISFGLFNNFAYSNYFFAVLSTIITIFLYRWMTESKKKMEVMALGAIIGGAIGNVSDRFIYPGVVDFLEFHWDYLYWPSFNVADSAICLGVCILLIFSIDFKHKVKEDYK